jgi:hypothetical protein
MTRGRAAKIVLLSGSSLCLNPRVMKEALTLSRAGHEVQVLGGWLDPALKERDLSLIARAPFAFTPVVDVTVPGMRDRAAHAIARVRRKAAHIAHRLSGRESPLQLGIVAEPLRCRAFGISADLYIAHSEPALHVAHTLLREGRRVGVDMEDWFSEDLLPEARRSRPLRLLRSLEMELLVRGAYASCPSQAMSVALAQEYGCAPPTVVYNAFGWSERKVCDGMRRDRRNTDIPSIHWYSTTLGPGRGLEDILMAVSLLQRDMEIHLRGRPAPGFVEWINANVPDRWRDSIFFHPLVANDQLLSRIAEHDIGFAGEGTFCRSRDLTATNKILHYLLGGLAVAASDTAGQSEVARQAPEAVLLYSSGNAGALANVVNALMASPERLRRAKGAALVAAQTIFCWERQEGVLLEAVAGALDKPVGAIR